MLKRAFILAASAVALSTAAQGTPLPASCPAGVTNSSLQTALQSAISQAHAQLGLGLNMWATVVGTDGAVCAVANSSGDAIQGQWLASRAISAQKAFTAVSLSLGTTADSGSGSANATGKLALSSANLYSAVQPEGSLFGLQESNPVFAAGAYGDTVTVTSGAEANYTGPYSAPSSTYGTTTDPMVGQIIGGINVFGGGLALYANNSSVETKVGGVGVSGDTSCQDHLIAWNLRHNLGLDHLGNINGVSGDPTHPDNIVFDIYVNSQGLYKSKSGWGHPSCGFSNSAATAVAASLPPVAKP